MIPIATGSFTKMIVKGPYGHASKPEDHLEIIFEKLTPKWTYIYIYIYIYTHTHTHIYIYIYIYICISTIYIVKTYYSYLIEIRKESNDSVKIEERKIQVE